MTSDQVIALVAIIVGATSTLITAYLAHRRAQADREHGRTLAEDERAHSLRLAQAERLFASRRGVYEEVLRYARTLLLRCEREFRNAAGRGVEYVLLNKMERSRDEVGKDDRPLPPEPTSEEWLHLHARLGAVGSTRVEAALQRVRDLALDSYFAVRTWERAAQDHPLGPEEKEEAQRAGDALDEVETAFRELEDIVREELTGS